jgi:hypothetical protein
MQSINYFCKIFTIITLIFAILNPGNIHPDDDDLAKVAILPYTDKTYTRNHEYLSESLADAVDKSMQEKFEYIRIDKNKVQKIAKKVLKFGEKITKSSGEEIAEDASADIIISGYYTFNEEENTISIHTTIYLKRANKFLSLPILINKIDSSIFQSTDKAATILIKEITQLAIKQKELDKEKAKPDVSGKIKLMKKLGYEIVNTSKFKTINENYYPDINPVYLGLIPADKMFFSASFNEFLQEPYYDLGKNNIEYGEQSISATLLGYHFPIVDNMGMGIEIFASIPKDTVRIKFFDEVAQAYTKSESFTRNQLLGGKLLYGIILNDNLGLGSSVSFFANNQENHIGNESGNMEIVKSLDLAGSFGFLIKNQQSTIIYDSAIGYTNMERTLINQEPTVVLNPDGTTKFKFIDFDKNVKEPIYNENTITFAFLGKQLFVVLKEINYIYMDRDYFVGRLIPGIEYWIWDSFSIRVGLEGCYQRMNNVSNFGYGSTGAFTFRGVDSGWEFNFNTTYRSQPSRIFEGESLQQFLTVFSITKNDVFFSR